MKSWLQVMLVLLVFSLLPAAFSAEPVRPEHGKEDPTKKNEPKKLGPDGKPLVVEVPHTAEEARLAAEKTKADARRSEQSVEDVLRSGNIRLEDGDRRALLEGMKASGDLRSAVHSLGEAVAKLKAKGGRLSVAQRQFLSTSVEYLRRAAKEPRLHRIQMTFGDAIQGGYLENVGEYLKDSMDKADREKKSLFDATREILEENGLDEDSLFKCRKNFALGL